MSFDCTFDLGQLDEFVRRLKQLDDPDAPAGIVEGLADMWVDKARTQMGKDTWQLYNRTGLVSLRATARHAEAVVQADTPYAGFHNYGTRYQAPNRFWDDGRDAAEREAQRLGGKVGTQIERVLSSGGSWNPRSLFP